MIPPISITYVFFKVPGRQWGTGGLLRAPALPRMIRLPPDPPTARALILPLHELCHESLNLLVQPVHPFPDLQDQVGVRFHFTHPAMLALHSFTLNGFKSFPVLAFAAN